MDETIRSLEFGKGAKNITVKVKANETLTREQLERKLRRYEKLIRALRNQLKLAGISPTSLREIARSGAGTDPSEDLGALSEDAEIDQATVPLDSEEMSMGLDRKYSVVNDDDLKELDSIGTSRSGTRLSIDLSPEDRNQLLSLQEINSGLVEENHRLTTERTEANDELEVTRHDLINRERELTELREQFAETEEQLKRYRSLTEPRSPTNDRQIQELLGKVRELDQVQQQLDDSRKLNERYLEHVTELKAQVNQFEQERTQLEQMREIIVSDGERQRDVKRLLKDKSLRREKSRSSEIVADHLSYLSELFPSADSVVQFEEKNRAVMDQMEAERRRLQELGVQHDLKMERLQERETEISQRHEAILRREIEAEQYKSKLEDLQSKMKSMQERERQIESREQELQMQQSRLTEAQESLHQRQGEHDRRVTTFEESWAQKASQQDSLQTLLDQLRVEQQQNQQTVEHLRNERSTHSEQAQKLRLKELDLEMKQTELDRKNFEMERDANARDAQLMTTKLNLDERAKELDQQQSRMSEQRNEFERERTEFEEEKADSQRLRERALKALDEIEQEKKRVGLLMDQLKIERESLKNMAPAAGLDDTKSQREIPVKISVPEANMSWTQQLDPLEPLRHLFGLIADRLQDNTFEFGKYTIEIGKKDVISGREDLDRLIGQAQIRAWHNLVVKTYGQKDPRYLHVGIRMKGDAPDQSRFTVKLQKGATVRELITLVAERVGLHLGSFTLVGKGKFLGFAEDMDLSLSNFGDFDGAILLCRESHFQNGPPGAHRGHSPVGEAGSRVRVQSEFTERNPPKRMVRQQERTARPIHRRRGSNSSMGSVGSHHSVRSEPPRPRMAGTLSRGRGRGRGFMRVVRSPNSRSQFGSVSPNHSQKFFSGDENDRSSVVSMPAMVVRANSRGRGRGRVVRGRGRGYPARPGSVTNVAPYRGPGSDVGGPIYRVGSDVGGPTYRGRGRGKPGRRGLDPNAVKYVMNQCKVSLKEASSALMTTNGNANAAIDYIDRMKAQQQA